MTSVDTGWISKMSPLPRQAVERQAPLDMDDATARVLDPILSCLIDAEEQPRFGVFLRNYHPASW